MFKYNCVVKSGYMNIITVLVNIGYKSKGNFNMDASSYLQTDATEETFLKFKADMREIENMKLEIAKEEILHGL